MVIFALRWWVPFVGGVGAVLAVLSLGGGGRLDWGHPDLAFAVVLAMTVTCVIGSAAVWVVGLRRRLAEVCLLGSAIWVVSLLPLVHGLLLPGYLYGPNPGTVVAVMAAVPAALVAALPLLLDGSAAGRWLARRWLSWSIGSVVLSVAGGGLLLAWPNSIAAPEPGSALTVSTVAVSVIGMGALSLRHLRLYAIGRRAGSLIASLGFAAPGLATLAFLGALPLSAAWWLAHLTDGFGVLFAVGGLLVAHRRDRSIAVVLSPVLTREPLAALVLGLTPVVHRFIAALEVKDAVTRQHVIRVSELAMRAAERSGRDPLTLRAVGLGALLHDVGKLMTPDAILTKAGSLTDVERATIERHPIDGEALLAGYPHLAEAAKIVRSHHERPDGSGYPDGLTAAQIPLSSSIVSVVDAWDAMVSDRPYRRGMAAQRAEAILREGAGTQWPAAAVDVVLAEIRHGGVAQASRLDAVGQRARHQPIELGIDPLAACLPDRDAISPAA